MFQDTSIWEVTWRSFSVSLWGTVVAFLITVPFAYLLALRPFWGRSVLLAFFQAMMAMPPVVIGLGLYLLFRPQALLGGWGWLYNEPIMVLAQFIIVFPILTSLGYAEFSRLNDKFQPLLSQYAAPRILVLWIHLREGQAALLVAAFIGFGRALGEVGAVMIVGGNLKGRTEMMTTVIVEETGKGNLESAMALGILLVVLALLISFVSFWGQKYMGTRLT